MSHKRLTFTAIAVLLPALLAEAKGNFQLEKDVVYLPPDRTETMDIYIPDNAGSKSLPCIMMIHGGGWGRGDKAHPQFSKAAADYVSEGYVVASINYYLVTKEEKERRAQNPGERLCYFDNLLFTWPRNIHDCKAAVRFLRKNATKYNIDPDRMAVLGASAGAHLATLVGLAQADAGLEPTDDGLGDIPSTVKCVISLYGIHDWNSWHKGTRGGKAVDTDEKKAIAAQASAITYVDSNDPPVLMLHGTKDKTVPFQQSKLLAEKLTEAGVQNKLIPFEGVDHSFFSKHEKKNKGEMKYILEFLKEHL